MSDDHRARRAGSMVVPHHARGARLARQRVATELGGLLAPGTLHDAVAVVAELLGNAVRHARPLPGGVIRVAWRIDPGGGPRDASVRLSVVDGGAAATPEPRDAGPDAVEGRGLAIVAAIARSWGVERDGETQCVWAEVGQAGVLQPGVVQPGVAQPGRTEAAGP